MSAADPSYGDENRKQLGLNINQITNGWIQYCIYNNTNCGDDLHWYWSYDYGNCFQFNVGLNYTNDFIERKQSNVC